MAILIHKYQSIHSIKSIATLSSFFYRLKLYEKCKLSFYVSVNCEWERWGAFSSCTKTCGGGTMYRTRSKSREEEFGGTCTGKSREEKTCNNQDCPGKTFTSSIHLIQMCDVVRSIY